MANPQFQIAVIEDVTDLRRLQNQLQFQAHHDMLTGLANRALFQLRLDHLVANPTPGKRLGVCLLDLDGFKAINDSVGHAVGDQVLIEIASRLDAALSPKGHLVARLGGDEFVILLEAPPARRTSSESPKRPSPRSLGPSPSPATRTASRPAPDWSNGPRPRPTRPT